MKTLLTCNLTTGAVTLGDAAWAPRVYVFEETPELAFRFTEEREGNTVVVDLEIVAARLALGVEDARPESGTWALQIGAGPQRPENTTEELGWDCPAQELAGAINALAEVTGLYGTAKVTKVDGSWKIRLGTGEATAPLRVVENALEPVSLGRVSRYQQGEQWLAEVRLTQAPLALADGVDMVLPEPPKITGIRDGGGSEGTTLFDFGEIQALFIPPDFRGSFYLRTVGGQQTTALDVTDTAASVQAALEAILGEGNIVVTNPQDFTLHLEWAGELIGIDQPLLEVVPLAPPAGDLTLTLDLGQAALQGALRRSATVVAPLELKLTVVKDGAVRKLVPLRVALTVIRSINWPELALVPQADYLRPPSPRTYRAFNRNNTVTGHQFSDPQVAGDGEATEFTHDHGFDSDVVLPWVRENAGDGRLLVLGTDYSVNFDSADSFTVTALQGAPAEEAWVICAVSAKTVSAFANELEVEIAQVTGLEAELLALQTQLAALQAQAATEPLGIVRSTAGSGVMIEIDPWEDAFPGFVERTNGVVNLATLEGTGGLLPAIHDATVTSIAALPLPSVAAAAGNVYRNDTMQAILVPGGLGARSSYLMVGEYAGSDGRRFYPLRRAGATNSFFPRDFERDPVPSFPIDETMLRAGSRLELSFSLATKLLQATSRAQYVLVIEQAAFLSQSTPAPTSPNLENYAWEPTAMLRQVIRLGDVKVTQSFGVEIVRAANGSLSANKVINGKATAAGSVPASANFALRARLINFDTENSALNAKGTIYLSLSSGKAEIQ